MSDADTGLAMDLRLDGGEVGDKADHKDWQIVQADVGQTLKAGDQGKIFFGNNDDGDEENRYSYNMSLVDHSWSRRILQLVGNKARLMESFSWLSTVGGGFSALGEQDRKFSARAGALSLGQQLKLAELLGDERLKVMCHLFAALAALQLNNKQFCLAYVRRVILPLINSLPYRDAILINILKHICFRLSTQPVGPRNAIEDSSKDNFRPSLKMSRKF